MLKLVLGGSYEEFLWIALSDLGVLLTTLCDSETSVLFLAVKLCELLLLLDATYCIGSRFSLNTAPGQ